MRTRVADLPGGFSFQYNDDRKGHGTWHFVGGPVNPTAWPTVRQRDEARACFTTRRSVAAALADLAKLKP